MKDNGALDIKGIKEAIPHRYPFLLVDRVLSITDSRIVAKKNLSFNEPFFQGHFSKLAVLPGVLAIEMIAQASGILFKEKHQDLLITSSLREKLQLGDDHENNIFALTTVKEAKFRQLMVPGDVLIIQSEIYRSKGRFCYFNGKIEVDGQLTVSAQIACTAHQV